MLVGLSHEFLGCRVVGNAQDFCVVREALAGANGDVAQQDELGQQAAPVEVASGGLSHMPRWLAILASLAGVTTCEVRLLSVHIRIMAQG